MQVEIKLDSSCQEVKVIVLTNQITEEVTELVGKLSAETAQRIPGFRENRGTLLDPAEILRIYAGEGKVFAETKDGVYTLRQRLYELEERLSARMFVRISHSELINLNRVRGFDLSLAGTICVTLTGGVSTYVSRRYVSKIKQVLGL